MPALLVRSILAASPRAFLRPLPRQSTVHFVHSPWMGSNGSVPGGARGVRSTTPVARAGSPDNPPAPFETVDVKKAASRLAAGTPILDVRTPAEFAGGHPPGAVNADVQGPDFLAAATAAFPDKGAPLLCSCLRGGRSAAACAQLAEAGYTNLINVAGGWSAWTEAGLPEEK